MRFHGSGVTFTFGVKPTGEQCLTVSGEDRPVVTAGAMPGEADPSETVAAKLSPRLLDSYGADPDSVKGHAA